MSQFFADYGLWLLIALLALIIVLFLLTRKRGDDSPASGVVPVEPVAATLEPAPAAAPPPPVAEATAPKPAAAPIPVSPAAAAIPEPAGDGDNLLLMKGVGPKLVALLHDQGVTRFAQIAAWTDADIAAIDAKLGNFKGRPVRDQWIDQAKFLARGDIAGFEARYGKV